MNEQEFKGKWKQFKGKAQRKWGELTDDDLDRIDGNRKVLVGVLQERYGKARQEVEDEVDDWFKSIERPAKTRV